MKDSAAEITKDRRLTTTVGVAVTAILFIIGGTSLAMKAKSDIEAANLRQDNEIANLRDKTTDMKETLAEIKADIKSLLRNKP